MFEPYWLLVWMQCSWLLNYCSIINYRKFEPFIYILFDNFLFSFSTNILVHTIFAKNITSVKLTYFIFGYTICWLQQVVCLNLMQKLLLLMSINSLVLMVISTFNTDFNFISCYYLKNNKSIFKIIYPLKIKFSQQWANPKNHPSFVKIYLWEFFITSFLSPTCKTSFSM